MMPHHPRGRYRPQLWSYCPQRHLRRSVRREGLPRCRNPLQEPRPLSLDPLLLLRPPLSQTQRRTRSKPSLSPLCSKSPAASVLNSPRPFPSSVSMTSPCPGPPSSPSSSPTPQLEFASKQTKRSTRRGGLRGTGIEQVREDLQLGVVSSVGFKGSANKNGEDINRKPSQHHPLQPVPQQYHPTLARASSPVRPPTTTSSPSSVPSRRHRLTPVGVNRLYCTKGPGIFAPLQVFALAVRVLPQLWRKPIGQPLHRTHQDGPHHHRR